MNRRPLPAGRQAPPRHPQCHLFLIVSLSSFLIFLTTSAFSLTEEILLNDLSRVKKIASANPEESRLLSTLERGIVFYRSIQDYKAVFHKYEISKDALGEKEEIYLKFEKPWKIYMGWLNTHKKGLQLVYERGKNDGKLAIHKPGLLFGLAPVVFLERSSPWVREGSESYDIEDAGLGTFLFDFTRAVIRSAKDAKLKVVSKGETREGDIAGEKMEVTFTGSSDDEDYFAYRILVLFDEQSDLPLQMELYDWQDKLTGTYSYNEFQANVGLDAEFQNQAHRQLYKIYSHEE